VYGTPGGKLIKLELSDRLIAGLGSGDYFDAKTPGLQVRVADTGIKSWYVVFTAPSGKRARVGLGRYPSTALARARALAIEARGQVERGIDPRGAVAAADANMTVAMLAETYIRKHAPALRGGRDLERRLRVDVLPAIGAIKLANLHRRDVHRFLDPINERGAPIAARRVFDDFRAMLRWAVARGDLDHDPLAGMKPPAASKPRERVLDDDEIKVVWQTIPTLFSVDVTLALKLALATGQRIGEVVGMSLSEIDFANRLWTIPAGRVKNKYQHSVPLSDLALELIAEARQYYIDGDRIFRTEPGLVARAFVDKRDRIPIPHFTAHDLRRTAMTGMARLGVNHLVIGHVANHRSTTRAGVTLGVYVQFSFESEKREALDLWAERLTAIIEGDAAKVFPIRGGR
jgi:integrase